MKKSLCLMLVLLFIGSFLIPTVGNASDASEQTAKQKYDALAAKGIFNGIDGEAALDQNMNRAQFARVAALILGLEGIGTPDTKVVDEKPFSDVELGTWYVEEIAAAKEAGLMIGNGNGTFNPSGDISVQELAVTTARLLNLEPVEDSNVEGSAPWAAGYIQALLNNGVDIPTNYTEPATRSDLVATSYAADTVITEKQEAEKKAAEKQETEKNEEENTSTDSTNTPSVSPLSIVDAKQVGMKSFYVKFNRKVDPAKIILSVTRNGHPVDVQAASDHLNGYNLTFAENVQEGSYIVTASYIDSSRVISSVNVNAAAETLTKIEFVSSDTVSKGNRLGILLKASNQFREAMSNLSGLEVYSSVPATIDSDRMVVVVDTSSVSLQSVISITVVNTINQITVNKIFNVGVESYASKAEFRGSLRDDNGQEVSHVDSTQTYHINFDLYDQYGHLLLYPLPFGADSFAASLGPDSADITVGVVSETPAEEPGTFSLPITFSPLGHEEGQEYTLAMIVGEATASQTIHLTGSPIQTLETPTANPASGAVVTGTKVSLSATGGATIYYTTDGSTPTKTNGLVYSVPIVVNSAMMVKALAVQNGMGDSDIMSASYTIIVQKAGLDLINEASKSGNWAGVDVTTFADAGVTGVTSEYLSGIQGILQDYDYPSRALPKTLLQIQRIVDETINFAAITNYFGYGNGSIPDKSIFDLAGITGVDDANLESILEALQTAYGEGTGGYPGGGPGGPGGGPGGGALTPMSTKQDIQNFINSLSL
ncbi:MAG TPA: chitobiase/beta-hexosaminidase C-terminal domain-containing protein [Candidatus Paenibacillus intestinavium]|nr:chitobiase/beta-hexosaminidase C-terminal domain-containing protein [Candidatus Paenibacillus intestinavium]